jgi:hypothetical protein
MARRQSVIKRLNHAWVLVKATSLAAQDNVDAALSLLDQTFLNQAGLWSDDLPLLATVRYAYLYERSEQAAKSVQALNRAVTVLDRGFDYDLGSIGKSDREYLYFYCKWLFSRVAHIDEGAAASALTIGGTFQTLDLTQTSKIIKKWFPISAEAAQQVDALIERRMPRLGILPI